MQHRCLAARLHDEGERLVTHFCSRESGHDGPHVALMVWSSDPEPNEARRIKRSDDGVPPLREIREAQGVGLRELARRLDVSASYLSRIERRQVKPSLRILRQIAHELTLNDLEAWLVPYAEDSTDREVISDEPVDLSKTPEFAVEEARR